MPNPTGTNSTYFKNLLLNTSRNSRGKKEGREWEAGEKEKILTDFRKNILRSFTKQGSSLPGFLWPAHDGSFLNHSGRGTFSLALDCPSNFDLAEGLLFIYLAKGSSRANQVEASQGGGPVTW